MATYGPKLYHWYVNRATNDKEILILLAGFEDESENVTYDAVGSIEEALQEALTQYDLSNVRLVRISQTFKRNEVEAVKTLGGWYNATLFIWGHYDDDGMYPRFTILQKERLNVVPEGPTDQLVNLASPPDDFTLFVNRDLPAQMTYFTQFTIGQIFYLKGSYAEALALFEDAVKSAETIEIKAIQSSLATIHFYKGYIYGAINKDYQQAIRDYTRAIELDPAFAYAYRNREIVYRDSGNLEQAIRDYTKAIELDPAFADAYISRGIAYKNSGDLELAIRDYIKAIELDPTNADTYYNRGIVYKNSDDLELAILDFEQYLELAPDASDREEVISWIEQLKAKLGGEDN